MIISNGLSKLYEYLNEFQNRNDDSNVIIAIDGKSASGKTTLSMDLGIRYDCNVFHMDDYFLRPIQRTKDRLSIPGENVDHERFLDEVLLPLSKSEMVVMQRFDCHSMSLDAPIQIPRKKINIIEGVYCCHPSLIKYYDLIVFMGIDEKLQRKRIEKRNTKEIVEKYFDTWIPLENRYFEEYKIKEKANIVLDEKE